MNIKSDTSRPIGEFKVLRAKVETKILEILLAAQQIYGRQFEAPMVVYRDIGGIGGLAWRRENKVEFSKTLLIENEGRFINQIVPHELAHLICFKVYPNASAHGPQWKGVMRRLGCEPSRCHSYDVSNVSNAKARPYTYVCRCGEMKLSQTLHFRAQLGKKYGCRKCGQKIIWKKLI